MIRFLLAGVLLAALVLVPPFNPRAHDAGVGEAQQVALHDHAHAHDHDDDPEHPKPSHAHHAADHMHDTGILMMVRVPERRAFVSAALSMADEDPEAGLIWLFERPPRHV